MKPSFSLKSLFVGMAFVAVLFGWIVDRRHLLDEQRTAYKRFLEKGWVLELLTLNDPLAPRVTDQWRTLVLTGGEIDERLASGLIGLCFPEIELVNVALRPEARSVLGRVYYLTVDGDVLHCRVKPIGQQ